jgi:hypothetical protein
MITKNDNIELMRISSEIQKIFDDMEELDDLQGTLEAQVLNAYLIGRKSVLNTI